MNDPQSEVLLENIEVMIVMQQPVALHRQKLAIRQSIVLRTV